MADKTYWKGIQDKNLDQLKKQDDQEFPEDLPVLGAATRDITNKESGRRDFLKMLGFSVSAAVVAASCEMPIRKSIPYVNKPEEITPGMPTYYASTYAKGGDIASILVKTREGRPIKIEGNPLELAGTNGGSSARVQASVLDLYSNKRIAKPYINAEESDWETLDKDVKSALGSGAKTVLLTGTITSPSLKAAIEKLNTKYPNLEHIQYDAVSYSGLLNAYQAMTGTRALPNYHFEKPMAIVSVNADFLGDWISPEQFAAAYVKNRTVDEQHHKMSRHIHIESRLSVTGSNADMRVPVRPSEQALAVAYIYNRIAQAKGGPSGSNVSFSTEGVKEKLDKAVEALLANAGKSLFVTGLNDPNVQLLGLMINDLLGNAGSGKVIDTDFPILSRQGDELAAMSLVDNLGSGVKGLITLDCNPAYSLPNASQFVEKAQNLDFHIAIGNKWDETSELGSHVCPAHHYLESWGDAMPSANMLCSAQPTISPLFDSKEVGQMLLDWAGEETTFQEFMKETWVTQFMSQQSKYNAAELFWNNAVHDGILHLDKATPATLGESQAANLASSASSAIASNYMPAEGMELEIYSKTAIGDGAFCDNPWSQEMPDPISRATWDNYVMANPDWLESQGLFDSTFYNDKYFMQVKLTAGNGYSVTLPIIPVPGMQKNTFAVALGYGRSLTVKENFRKMEFFKDEYEAVIGQNVYPMLSFDKQTGSVGNIVTDVSFEKVEEKFAVATIQDHAHITHQTLGGEKTRLVVKETSLEAFKEDPWAGNTIMGQRRDKWVEKHLSTLYGYHDNLGHHWGMSIDLNACYGCGACVVACNAENNVPVVGKEEVRRAHEMHWLRIDRYYIGEDNENPTVVFQPMMCQHCDNAPCENVCPVAATNHSSEGLNQMAYNRCIGTRYCANNCPYKVRRFNWFDYTGSDSFYKDTIFDNDRDAAKLLEDLPRMVMNPDVTIRSRGVMEKCSFCVQRIQYGKLEAKKSGAPLEDGSIKTACQQACSTNAIKFGDLNNPESQVAKNAADPRSFGVIEEIHTLPTVNYMVKVRNVEEAHEENEMA